MHVHQRSLFSVQYTTTELPHEMATHGRREATLLAAKRSHTGMPGVSERRQKPKRKTTLPVYLQYYALG